MMAQPSKLVRQVGKKLKTRMWAFRLRALENRGLEGIEGFLLKDSKNIGTMEGQEKTIGEKCVGRQLHNAPKRETTFVPKVATRLWLKEQENRQHLP
jgi:hypothetical protein